MPDALSAANLPCRCIEAAVQVGPTVTCYLRAGSGPPLVVLTGAREGSRPEGLWEALGPELVGCFRLMIPAVPENVPGFGPWLRGFLEGVGVERTRLLADAAFASRALDFAAQDPDRVDRLVVLSDEPTVASRKWSAGTKVLLLEPSQPARTVAVAVMNYLAPGETA